MKIQTDKGQIRIGSEVFTNITGAVATSCYGVKGMAVRSKTDGLVHLLRREFLPLGLGRRKERCTDQRDHDKRSQQA